MPCLPHKPTGLGRLEREEWAVGSLMATLRCIPASHSIPRVGSASSACPEENRFYRTGVSWCPCVFLLHGPSHKTRKDPPGTAALKGQKTAEKLHLAPQFCKEGCRAAPAAPCFPADAQRKLQLAQNPRPRGIWAAEKRHLSRQRGPK